MQQPKTGAENLIDALIDRGVDHCFANPGTSEMHFVHALDHSPHMRAVLGLFEGVVTGAADGYGRMARKEAGRRLEASRNALLIVGVEGLLEDGLMAAGRISSATGTELLAPTFCGRIERGTGRIDIARIPYPVDQALERLKDFSTIILAGAKEPVAFFAYPGKPSKLLNPEAQVFQLASRNEDVTDALQRLADILPDGSKEPAVQEFTNPRKPEGHLTADAVGQSVAAHMPKNAIIADESVSSGRSFFQLTRGAPAHTWLPTSSGSIGIGLPMSIGAAVACPDRQVINLQADGSAMYTLQSLWTIAREKLNVVTIILANRGYAILRGEMVNVGLENPGPVAKDLLDIDRPELDWISLTKGMGVEATCMTACEQLNDALEHALSRNGPFLIEARLN